MREKVPAPSQSTPIRVVKWLSVTVMVASITAFALAASLNQELLPEWFQEQVTAIRIASPLIALAAGGWRWHLRDNSTGATEEIVDDPAVTPSVDQKDFASTTRQAFESLCLESFRTAEPIEKLLYSILSPGHLGDRASKKVSLVAPYHKTRLSRTLTIGSSGALVPILKARKSTLRDGLSCELDGRPVATLSRLESHGAMLELVDILTRVTFKRALAEPAISNLANTVTTGIASDTALSREQLKALTDTVSALARLYPDLVDRDDVQNLHALLAFSSAYYCLIALIPAEDSHDSTTDQPAKTRKRKLVVEFFERLQQGPRTHVDRVRGVIGLSPREFGILVPEALDSSSVHVHCQAPPGMYTFRAIPRVIFPRQLRENALRPHKQVSATLGLDYVHAYFRDLNGPLVDGELQSDDGPTINRPVPVLQVEFRETPPGLLLPLLLTSTYLAVIVLAVGWNPTYLAQGGSSIILSIPAVVAGWMVTRFDVQALRRISIPTALLAFWFVVNTGVVLTNATAAAATSPSLSAIPVVGWFVVTATCVAHLTSLAYVYVNRMIRHQQRLNIGDE